MGILSWIVVGFIAGWLAGLVVKGHGYGCIGDIVVGVIGALLGGWIASHFFHMGDLYQASTCPPSELRSSAQ